MKKVFVSFDFDNDRALKEFIVAQAKLPDSRTPDMVSWILRVRGAV